MDLALSVTGLAAGDLIERALGEPLGGPARLLQGVLPGAAKLHDLGAMDQAETVVGDHLGLSVAPSRQGLGPLPRMAEARMRRDRTRSCCNRRSLAEPLADLGGLGSRRVGGLVIAASHVHEPDRDQEVAALDAIPLEAREQAIPARKPSARRSTLATEEQV